MIKTDRVKNISIRISQTELDYIRRAIVEAPRQSMNTFVIEAALSSAKNRLNNKEEITSEEG